MTTITRTYDPELWPYQRFSVTIGELLDAAIKGVTK